MLGIAREECVMVLLYDVLPACGNAHLRTPISIRTCEFVIGSGCEDAILPTYLPTTTYIQSIGTMEALGGLGAVEMEMYVFIVHTSA